MFRYDSVSDQLVLHNVQGVVKTPWELRQEVCTALRYLPDRFGWISIIFDGSFERYSAFIAQHQRSTEWTDVTGIMVGATALYLGKNVNLQFYLLLLNIIYTFLGRRIRIYGTNNIGTSRPFFEIWGGDGSDTRDHINIGHYTDQHYVSIHKVVAGSVPRSPTSPAPRCPTYPDPQSPTSPAQRSSPPTPRSSTPIPRSSTPIPISPIPALRSPSTPSPAPVQTSNPSQCDVSGILNH